MTTNTGAQAPGDMFLAPYAGPGQYGPMILDGAGKLLWFKPIPSGERAADLRVQQYEGHPVLTWWQDPLVADGRNDAGVVIADSSYQDIAIVRAGNGYQPDLHAFDITPQGTALFTVYDAIRCNLSAYGGPADGAVADTLVQEIDLKTGLVRFEWHSLDHVALADSYMPIGHGGTPTSPWDWFHINAVSEPPGMLLIDSRNTWAAYDVDPSADRSSGRSAASIRASRWAPARAPPGSTTSARTLRHDLLLRQRRHAQGALPVARDRAGARHPQDDRHARLELHPLKAAARSQPGRLPAARRRQLVRRLGPRAVLLGILPRRPPAVRRAPAAAYQSYTVLKFPWTGAPPQPPRLAVRAGAHGGLIAYASWNGATDVAQWQLLGGASAQALAPIATAAKNGFETVIPTSTSPRYLAVQALDAQGRVLAVSSTTRS